MRLKKLQKQVFTTVELIIVVSILLILSTLIAPSFNKVIYSSQITNCKVQLSTIFNAISLYSEDYNSSLPGPSGRTAAPHYFKKINYTKLGEPSRRNQKFSSYIYPYMTFDEFDDRFNYIPGLMCPSNTEIDFKQPPEFRAHYFLNNNRKNQFAFGSHKHKKVDGTIMDLKLPKQLIEIQNPSETYALKDALDKRDNSIPNIPVHPEFLENFLYFDGHVETVEFNITY